MGDDVWSPRWQPLQDDEFPPEHLETADALVAVANEYDAGTVSACAKRGDGTPLRVVSVAVVNDVALAVYVNCETGDVLWVAGE